ncbi:MAG: undecaprenyl-diphosphatase UppP [Candidatus Pacebacteria bacterium]|nr:undecaprenyl-diphosphatase UppP [Candidatus Paceibacterota bacterium]
MNYLQSVIMGIVEGFTEFLPVSSTAHLILSAKVLRIAQSDFVKSFEIVIQLGAILAVVWLYWKKLFADKEAIKRIAVAFAPTAVLGFLLYKIFKSFLMENVLLITGALVAGGVFLVVFELLHKERPGAVEEIGKISYKQSFVIGVCQSVAIVPGVSRSAATILGGIALGLKRKTIVEFSFLLAVPTMIAATAYDLLKSGVSFQAGEVGVLAVGFIVSFLVAVLAVKLLLGYVQKNNFIWFGVYRVVIGLLFILLMI